MSYPVIDIEGIGPNYAERLKSIGIDTTEDLLQKGGTKRGRQIIAEQTEIPESLVLTWVNHADLFRIHGVAGKFAELLEAAGVDTVRELATRNPDHLFHKLTEINAKYGLSGKVPTSQTLKDMIDSAKKLEPKVTH